jgi:neuropeptide S receptor
MSYDRYLSICKPLASLPASTQTRQHRMIAIAWMMAFVFATPQLIIFKQVFVMKISYLIEA